MQIALEAFTKALPELLGGSADLVSGAYEHTINMQAKQQMIKSVVVQGRYAGIVLGLGKDKAAAYKSPKDLKGLKIGVPKEYFIEGLAKETAMAIDEVIKNLKSLGFKFKKISLPHTEYALSCYYIIMPAEVSSNLARFDGMRYGLAKRGENLLDDYVQSRTEGFGRETLRRILLGTFVLSAGYIDAYYRMADAARAALRAAYEQALKSVDVVATPTMPTPAFKIGEKNDPLSMYLEDIFTVTANLTGMPALSVPMGVVEREGKQLPVGIHFTALHQSENILFSLGEEVQRTS